MCATLKPVGVAIGVLGAVFGITGLGVAWLIDGSVHWWPSLGVHGPGPSQGIRVRHGTAVIWFGTLLVLWEDRRNISVHESSRWSRFHLCFLSCPLGNNTERNEIMCQTDSLPRRKSWYHAPLVYTLKRPIGLIAVVSWNNCEITRPDSGQKNSTTAVMRSLQYTSLCKFTDTKRRNSAHKTQGYNTHGHTQPINIHAHTHRNLEANMKP